MTSLRGFTLLELLIVVMLIGVASAVASLALRDSGDTRLEREALRLASLFESARAQARGFGTVVRWQPRSTKPEADFEFTGLPEIAKLPERWLEDETRTSVQIWLDDRRETVVLGPEPVIPAQAVILADEHHRIILRTDGLGPFLISHEMADPAASAAK
ncbi:MAG: Tfp pilus assembly protein FimT/FimU [Leptothrix ochracea]|uniref:pilus assembly FimT family protein n=1 Tax=Leptothrix ochracea TaxID=735331 RepID=UPI0034E23CD6